MVICKNRNSVLCNLSDQQLLLNSIQSTEIFYLNFYLINELLLNEKRSNSLCNFCSDYIRNVKNTYISRTIALKLINLIIITNFKNINYLINNGFILYAYKILKRDKDGNNKKCILYFGENIDPEIHLLIREAKILFSIISLIKELKKEKDIKKIFKKFQKNKIDYFLNLVPLYNAELEINYDCCKEELINLLDKDDDKLIEYNYSIYTTLKNKLKDHTIELFKNGEYREFSNLYKKLFEDEEIKIRYESYLIYNCKLNEDIEMKKKEKPLLNKQDEEVKRKIRYKRNTKLFEDLCQKNSNYKLNKYNIHSTKSMNINLNGTKKNVKKNFKLYNSLCYDENIIDKFDKNKEIYINQKYLNDIKVKNRNKKEKDEDNEKRNNNKNKLNIALENESEYDETLNSMYIKEIKNNDIEKREDNEKKEINLNPYNIEEDYSEEEDIEEDYLEEDDIEENDIKKDDIKEDVIKVDIMNEYDIEEKKDDVEEKKDDIKEKKDNVEEQKDNVEEQKDNVEENKDDIKEKKDDIKEKEDDIEKKKDENRNEELYMQNNKINNENGMFDLNSSKLNLKKNNIIQKQKMRNSYTINDDDIWNNLVETGNFYSIKIDFQNYYNFIKQKEEEEEESDNNTLGELIKRNNYFDLNVETDTKIINLNEQNNNDINEIQTNQINCLNKCYTELIKNIDVNVNIKNLDSLERKSDEYNEKKEMNNVIDKNYINKNTQIVNSLKKKKNNIRKIYFNKHFTMYDNIKFIKKMILKNSSLLYSDSQIEVWIKGSYYGVKGLLSLYLKNKKGVNYYDVNIQIPNKSLFPLKFKFLNKESVLNYYSTNCYEIAIKCMDLYKGFPLIKISYRMQDMLKKNVELRIPIAINKFMKKLKISKDIFNILWRREDFDLNKYEKIILKDYTLNHEDIYKNSCLGNALNVCFVEDKIYLCGSYYKKLYTHKKAVVLVTIEEIKNEKLKIVCKSNSSILSCAILFLLLLILKDHEN